MVISEQHHLPAPAAERHGVLVAAGLVPFEARWAAWVERGRAQERRGRRRRRIWTAVIAAGTAIGYAFLS